MIQDVSVTIPNRRSNSMDNAERVHTELLHQAAVTRQAYEEQQANISANVPIRRERM
jgi:hypothetical protein